MPLENVNWRGSEIGALPKGSWSEATAWMLARGGV